MTKILRLKSILLHWRRNVGDIQLKHQHQPEPPPRARMRCVDVGGNPPAYQRDREKTKTGKQTKAPLWRLVVQPPLWRFSFVHLPASVRRYLLLLSGRPGYATGNHCAKGSHNQYIRPVRHAALLRYECAIQLFSPLGRKLFPLFALNVCPSATRQTLHQWSPAECQYAEQF